MEQEERTPARLDWRQLGGHDSHVTSLHQSHDTHMIPMCSLCSLSNRTKSVPTFSCSVTMDYTPTRMDTRRQTESFGSSWIRPIIFSLLYSQVHHKLLFMQHHLELWWSAPHFTKQGISQQAMNGFIQDYTTFKRGKIEAGNNSRAPSV